VTFTEPAKGEGEFDLSMDNENFRGEIISGKFNVRINNSHWDMQDYRVKRKHLEEAIETLLQLTGSTITRTIEYINT
jgi:hypothetical protein